MVQIYSLTGASGTGKSSSAISFAHEHEIPAIIDDGLLIHNGKKIAGSSAKFEKTTVAAVKRAVFLDDKHAESVRQAIEDLKIDRILLIGTSDRMVKRIAERLQIGEIDMYYYIEDILSPEEIKEAQHERVTTGKHIIPLSHTQLQQNVFKKIIQKGIEIFSPRKEKIGETTIVHPFFHRRLLARRKKAQEKQAKTSNKQKTVKKYTASLHIDTVPVTKQFINIAPSLIEHIKSYLIALQERAQEYCEKSLQYIYKILLHLLNKLRNVVLNYYLAYKLR